MRATGMIDDTSSLGAHDHVCWAFDEPAEFHTRAARFLWEGIAAGYQAWYVAGSDPPHELTEMPGFDAAVERGAVKVVAVHRAYPTGKVVDPFEQVRIYSRATDEAVAAGFAGLRVAADATSFVMTDPQLDAFARYEFLIDTAAVDRPFSALCAYNRSIVGDATIAQLACLHPGSNSGRAPFHLFGGHGDGAHASLIGEVDLAGRTLFPQALRRAVITRPAAGSSSTPAAWSSSTTERCSPSTSTPTGSRSRSSCATRRRSRSGWSTCSPSTGYG